MPKRGRPSRDQGRLVLNLLRDGRTAPDGWLPDERAAVTEFHLWAHGAPPRLGPEVAERLGASLIRRAPAEDPHPHVGRGGPPPAPEPIRAGDPLPPLPSEVLASLDGGRGIAGWILTPEALDHLPTLSRTSPEEDAYRAAGFSPDLARLAVEEDAEDRFAEGLLDDLRRLGDEYGPLGVAIAAATLTDPRAVVAQIDPDRPQPDRPRIVPDLGIAGGDGEPFDAQIARLAEWIVDNVPGEPSRSEGAVDCALRLLGDYRDRLERAETWEAIAAEGHDQYARLRARLDEEVTRADAGQAVVDRLREFVANLAAEDWSDRAGVVPWVLTRPERIAASIEEQVLGDRVVEPHREPHRHPHPFARYELSVAGPGLVTCDGRMLRVEYEHGGYDVTAGTPAEVTPDPTDEEVADARTELGLDDAEATAFLDHHRPIPAANAWPDDSVLLSYTELRRLVALHLDTCRHTLPRERPWEYLAARATALRDGEVPLLIAEVLQS